MNRFAALDIEEFEPDVVEQEHELAENVRAAKKAGLGPELEDLKKLIALQRSGGSVFAKKLYDYDDPRVKAEVDELFAETKFSDLVGDERNWGQFMQGTQYVISHVPPHVWRCKDGRTLFVEAMSDTHLLNSARLLMRKLEADRPQRQVRFSLKVLQLEANHRGRLL